MKKFKIFLFGLFCLSFPSYAQLTSVTATITDSDSQTWNNCTWKLQWVSNGQQTNPNIYNINGVSITSPTYSNYLNQTGSCNNSGALSLTALDNTQVSPSGSQYVFTIQSFTSAPATQYLPLTVSGSSLNLTSYLSLNAIAPRIKIGNLAGIYAYADVEITNSTCGNIYWNTIASQSRQWNCSSNTWNTLVTSTWNGGTVLNPVQAPSYSCTGSPSTCYTGNLTGNVTGNLTGNVTGNVTGTASGNVSLSQTSLQSMAGPLIAPCINGMCNADWFGNSDIGVNIIDAVNWCKTAGFASCSIFVSKSGNINTNPELPQNFSLFFNPQGNYNLNTHWVIDHSNTFYQFNNALITYTLNDGGKAVYVGKNNVSVVNVVGTTVNWVSGSTFSNVDIGDQIAVDTGSYGPEVGIVSNVNSSTQLTLTSAIGNLTGKNAIFQTYVDPSSYGTGATVIKNLHLLDSGSGTETALTVELASVNVDGFKAQTFANGTCLALLGSISNHYNDVSCNQDKYNVTITENSIGGFFYSTANANVFTNLNLTSSTGTSGWGLQISGSSQNQFFGLHEEGVIGHINNIIQKVAATGYPATIIQSYSNQLFTNDWERNCDNTTGSTEISLLDATQNTIIEGGLWTSTYGGFSSGCQNGIIAAATTVGTHIQDLSFLGPYASSYNFSTGATCHVTNVIPVGSNTACQYIVDSFGNETNNGTTTAAVAIKSGGSLTLGVNTILDSSDNIFAGAGSSIIYRCVTAGSTLPVGSLTINASACGSTADSGLRIK